ncbi:hypothetical protein [Piscibacillus halophilus]|uniref:hypothetical protein n=1 Tax=Piscibacillus halophilus TaxID=571933 RepID=UPI0015888306|nr:hypothetical protein [Piscibacillus halophilus]
MLTEEVAPLFNEEDVLEYKKYGNNGTDIYFTSKAKSHEYHINTNDKALDELYTRSVTIMPYKDDFNKSFVSNIKSVEFNNSIKEYLGDQEYISLRDFTIVKKDYFNDLVSIKELFDNAIDEAVEEIALERKAEEFTYDLSTVMEKLDLTEEDFEDILSIFEDEED